MKKQLKKEAKVKRSKKIGRIKMMGRQKKEKAIPQELQIQKIIQPTHGIISVKLVKSSKQLRITANREQ